MSVVEDIALRMMYFESRNVLEIDLITANSFGRVQTKCESDIDDLNAVVVPELIGLNVLEQQLFDDILSDVVEEGRVRFGFSLACAKTASTYVGLPLYQYLGGIFSRSVPSIILGDSIVNESFVVTGKRPQGTSQQFDTLTAMAEGDRHAPSCLAFTDEGSWHVACGMSYDYIEIFKKEDINELLRIKEHMLEM